MIIISGTINDGTQIAGRTRRGSQRGREGEGGRKGRKVLPIITYN